MIIRYYEPKDLSELHRIDRICFPEGVAYPLKELRFFIEHKGAVALVAEAESCIAGFIIAHLEKRRFGHIITLDVRPDYRQKGVGGQLLRQTEQWLKNNGAVIIYLETDVENMIAIRFYKKHGYRIVERLEHYYASGSDAYQMVKSR
jgi:ribosomal-protein-alanine N-acetyltransferase